MDEGEKQEEKKKIPIISENKDVLSWIVEYVVDKNFENIFQAMLNTFEDLPGKIDFPSKKIRYTLGYLENVQLNEIAQNLTTFINALFSVAPEDWVLSKDSLTCRLLIELFFQLYLRNPKEFLPLFRTKVLKSEILHDFKGMDTSEIGQFIQSKVLTECTKENYENLQEEHSLEGFKEMIKSYVGLKRKKLEPTFLETLVNKCPANTPLKTKTSSTTTTTTTTTSTPSQPSPQKIGKNHNNSNNNNNNNKHKNTNNNDDNNNNNNNTSTPRKMNTTSQNRSLSAGRFSKWESSKELLTVKELKTVALNEMGKTEKEWKRITQGISPEIAGFLKHKRRVQSDFEIIDLDDEETQNKAPSKKVPEIEVSEDEEIALGEETHVLINNLAKKSETLKNRGQDPLPNALKSTTQLQKGKMRKQRIDEENGGEEEEVEEIENPRKKHRGKQIRDNVSLSDKEHQDVNEDYANNDVNDSIESEEDANDFILKHLNSPKKAATINPLRTVGGLPDERGTKGSISGVKKTPREGNLGRRPWTEIEVQNLLDGIRRFGVGNWSHIEQNYNFNNRLSIDLKDKYRNLKKAGALNVLIFHNNKPFKV